MREICIISSWEKVNGLSLLHKSCPQSVCVSVFAPAAPRKLLGNRSDIALTLFEPPVSIQETKQEEKMKRSID